MQNLRQQIDEIDRQIINLLIKRMGISKQIGQLKKEFDLPIQDKKREKELKTKLTEIAAGNLSDQFIDKLYDLILKESRKMQE